MAVDAAVEPEDVAGKRVWLNFAAFGFANRTCQLDLQDNGNCVFSQGMVTSAPGAWRIEEQEGVDYLQFTSPLTELYIEIFEIPSRVMFWRVPVSRDADGKLVIKDGVIISEKKSWFGLKTDFVGEGSFSGHFLEADEPFPDDATFNIKQVFSQRKGGAKQRKKKAAGAGDGGSGGGMEATPVEITVPPLPSDRGILGREDEDD